MAVPFQTIGRQAALAHSRNTTRADLTPAYSSYLDLVRCCGAFAVFLEHLASYPFSRDTPASNHPLLAALGDYGNTAVIIFFVLSGYVIAYVVSTRERTVSAYTISRISRLYSVVIPALVLTCALDAIGQKLRPEFYEIPSVLWQPSSWQGYLASAFFVNEYTALPFNGLVPGTNSPFWSLSFEATYYVFAGLVWFLPLRFAVPMVVVLLAAAGRTISALLPLWFLGVWVYAASQRLTSRLPVPAVLFMLSSAAIVALPQIPQLAAVNNFGAYFPWGHGPYNRNLVLDYATAVAFAVQMVVVRQLLTSLQRLPLPLERAIRWLGSITFPMYAMHYPVLCLFAALNPFERSSWPGIAFVTAAVLAVVTLLSPACEWLRRRLRRAMALA